MEAIRKLPQPVIASVNGTNKQSLYSSYILHDNEEKIRYDKISKTLML